MSKLFTPLIFLVLTIQVNSLDRPAIWDIQNLANFAHDVNEIFSQSVNLKDSSIEDEENPVTMLLNIVDTMANETIVIADINRILGYYINEVDFVYQNFREYAADLKSFNNDTISDFIEIATIEGEGYIPDAIAYMELEIIPPNESGAKGPWQIMIEQQKDPAKDHCGMDITLQQRMYELYNIVIITEIKALIVTMGAYNFEDANKDEISSSKYDETEARFVMRAQHYLAELKEVMSSASREIYSCDSKTHTPGENYVEFDGLFAAFVVNEIQANRQSLCAGRCSDLESWGSQTCQDLRGKKICSLHPCEGLIYDCEWIGGDVDVCEEGQESRKRYRFVRSYDNGWYGKWDQCLGGQYYEYRGPYSASGSCDTCICSCAELFGESKAIRTFSLRPQISNIDENKVVSNVRFVSQDNLIHIQIEESPLLASGKFDESQSSWIPLENFIYLSNSTIGDFAMLDGDQYIPLKRGIDYTYVTKVNDVLNVDEISAGLGYVLTGIRLNHEIQNDSAESEYETLSNLVSSQPANPFRMEIHVTPFDYYTGKLNPTRKNPSIWLTAETQPKPPDAYSKERSQIMIGNKGYKYEPSVHHTSKVEPNQFLKFRASSVHSDIGQSTLPLFDSRPIESANTLALNGIGILYRQADEFGGLLALKLLIIDLAGSLNPYMNEN